MTGDDEAQKKADMVEADEEASAGFQGPDPSFAGELAVPLGVISCRVLAGLLINFFG